MDKQIDSRLHAESPDFGNKHRVEQLEQMNTFIKNERSKADVKRSDYFTPDYASIDTYEKSIVKHRERYRKMLGYPLSPCPIDLPAPNADIEFVAEDELGKIYRLHISTLSNLTTYGILFIPKTKAPHPLIIAQHGGGGTPELCSGLCGYANYNDMTRRVLRKGYAVFAPQLLLWNPETFGPEYDRKQIDADLKQLGSSITALEIFRLQRCLDYLLNREDIDENRVGMIGLSYGGFYTLYTAAADTRIKAAASSCFYSNRFEYSWSDWTWFDAGNTYLDAEIAMLVCPRPLYIEVGTKDELFDVDYAREEIKKAKAVYEKLGISDRIEFNDFEGTHELCWDSDPIDFLCKHV